MCKEFDNDARNLVENHWNEIETHLESGVAGEKPLKFEGKSYWLLEEPGQLIIRSLNGNKKYTHKFKEEITMTNTNKTSTGKLIAADMAVKLGDKNHSIANCEYLQRIEGVKPNDALVVCRTERSGNFIPLTASNNISAVEYVVEKSDLETITNMVKKIGDVLINDKCVFAVGRLDRGDRQYMFEMAGGDYICLIDSSNGVWKEVAMLELSGGIDDAVWAERACSAIHDDTVPEEQNVEIHDNGKCDSEAESKEPKMENNEKNTATGPEAETKSHDNVFQELFTPVEDNSKVESESKWSLGKKLLVGAAAVGTVAAVGYGVCKLLNNVADEVL